MCGRPTGCVTARLPHPPNAIGRLVARHPLPTAGHPPHTPKPTLQKGWAPWKTPFPGGPAAIPSCSGAARAAAACTKRERTEEDRAHREEAGPVQPAAARGGRGRDGTGEEGGGRAGRPGGAPRPPGSHPIPRAAGRAPAPAAGAVDVQNPGPCGPRAHHLPLTAERDWTGRRGAARPVSLCHAVLPPNPPRRCRRRRRRGAGGPFGSAGQ